MTGLEIAGLVAFYLIGGTVTVGVSHRVDPHGNPDADVPMFLLWPLIAGACVVYYPLWKVYRIASGGTEE